jgi:acyl transferase domain-containing protein
VHLCIRLLPGQHNSTHLKLGLSTTADVDAFDAGLFGVSAAEALFLDPQQRLLLEAAHVVLSTSGLRRQAGFSGAGANISAAGPTAPAARCDSCPWSFDT